MGTVVVKMQVGNPTDLTRRTTIELMVDTGAIYSIIPAPILHDLGVQPKAQKTLRTADGRTIECVFGDASFVYNGEEGISRVIFGEEAGAAVLGVHALEALGLQGDPVTGELRPSTLELYAWAGHGFSERSGDPALFAGSRAGSCQME
ncbi:MAG: aspartyl protease [Terriglobia bacterium]